MIQDVLRATFGQFVVDNTVASVAVTGLATPTLRRFLAPGGVARYLAPNDNCIVETIAVGLPFAFITANVTLSGAITGIDSAATTFNIGSISSGLGFWQHSENVEIDRKVYVPFTLSPAGLKWIFYVTPAASATVCCLNSPAILNGQTYDISAVLKMSHTLPLIA